MKRSVEIGALLMGLLIFGASTSFAKERGKITLRDVCVKLIDSANCRGLSDKECNLRRSEQHKQYKQCMSYTETDAYFDTGALRLCSFHEKKEYVMPCVDAIAGHRYSERKLEYCSYYSNEPSNMNSCLNRSGTNSDGTVTVPQTVRKALQEIIESCDKPHTSNTLILRCIRMAAGLDR